MIPNMRAVCNLLAGALFVCVLSAADITGIWTGQVQGRNGEMQEVTFRFKQDGQTLTGKMYGDNEDTMLADGKITGDQISFSVNSDLFGGRAKFVYTGAVNGSSMQLTRDREGSRPGGNGGERRNFKQSFTLKRMM
jgi:hypothetical protein